MRQLILFAEVYNNPFLSVSNIGGFEEILESTYTIERNIIVKVKYVTQKKLLAMLIKDLEIKNYRENT